MNEIIAFLKHPAPINPLNKEIFSIKLIAKYLSILVIIKIIGNIVCYGLLFLLNPIARLLKGTCLMEFVFKNSTNIPPSAIDMILIGMIIGPIFEELIFRLPLAFKSYYLALSISLLFFMLLPGNYLRFNISFFTIEWFLSILSSVILFIILNVVFSRYSGLIEKWYYCNYKYIFYFLSILFSYLHYNENLTWYILLISPVYFLPHFLSSIMFSYIRIRYGFINATILHVFSNVIFISPSLFL